MKQPDPQTLLAGLHMFGQAQALHAARRFPEAAAAYLKALRLVPDHPQMLVAYAQLAEDVGDWPGAERLYRRLLATTRITNLDGKLAVCLFHLERYAEAIPPFETFTRNNPGEATAWCLLGTCLFRESRFPEAIASAQRAWSLSGSVDSICLLLAIHVELGERAPLDPLVEEALARFPEHWQVRKLAAEHLLKAGDYARGFAFFEQMRIPANGVPIVHHLERAGLTAWDGRPFEGTLLVGAEQGIGDEILVSSMFGELAGIATRVIVEADARLLGIFRRAFPAITFIERNQRGLLQWSTGDATLRWTLTGNLGRFFRGNHGWQHPPGGWLSAEDIRREACRTRYRADWPGQALVGLSWKSRRDLNAGTRKDVGLAACAPLVARDGFRFINLQYGDIRDETSALGNLGSRLYVDPGVDTRDDMDALFAQVAALDLVITSSNVTAHVAGALGVPCWVLLPRARPVIWYWGYAGDSTPWYPRTRLWRNPDEDDWTTLVAAVGSALDAWLRTLPGRDGLPTPSP